jgi:predicted transposase/invertase (TIGR01784 family)
MGVQPSNPHDALFRSIMQRDGQLAGELQIALPPEIVKRIDWTVWRYIPNDLVAPGLECRQTDLFVQTRFDGADALIYIHVEHQSRPDPLMTFRMGEYMFGHWRQYIDRSDKVPTSLPVIIPVVVNSGPRNQPWNYSTQFADMFALAEDARAALTRYLPTFEIIVDDIAAIALDDLAHRPIPPAALLVFVLHKSTSKNPDLARTLAPVIDQFHKLENEPCGMIDLRDIIEYILEVGEVDRQDFVKLIDQFGPRAKEEAMTTAERFIAHGEERGLEKGEVRGQAKTLLRLLAAKFGDIPAGIDNRIHSAGPDQLDQWTLKILTATTIDEIFEQFHTSPSDNGSDDDGENGSVMAAIRRSALAAE